MRIIGKVGLTSLVIACICSLVLPTNSQAANADKVITSGSGPYGAGDIVDLQIRVPYPDEVTVDPIEVVIVVDASGSMEDDIEAAKIPLKNFADSLSSYPGAAKVSIVSFGRLDPSQPGDEAQSPNLDRMLAMRTINDSGDILALKNAIDNISVSGASIQYSDIREGIIYGNQQFTSSSNVSVRYLALLTDGLHNMPASDSNIYGKTGFDGECVLTDPYPDNPYTGSPNMSGLDYDYFDIIPGGDISDHLTTDSSLTPGLRSPCNYPYNDPNVPTGSQFINMMADGFPNADRRSSMNDAIDVIETLLRPESFRLNDRINTNVFSEIVSAEKPRNCRTNSFYSGLTTISSSEESIQSRVFSNVSRDGICIRFRARVKASPGSGSQNINSSINSIVFENDFGDVISRSKVKLGTIQVQDSGDLQAVNLILNDADSDASKRVFEVGERIYMNVWMRNLTSQSAAGTAITTFHKNQTSSASPGQWTDVPSYITINNWPGNTTYHFRSRPGSSTAGSFLSRNYWLAGDTDLDSTIEGPGDYRARMHVNYREDGGSVSETSYNNNQDYVDYSAVNPPTNLHTTNLACNSATVAWNPGSSNINGYRIYLSPEHGGSYPRNIGNLSGTDLGGLQPETTYTWRLSVYTDNGYSDVLASDSFRTPACPTYETSFSSPITVKPGSDEDVYANVSIEYQPDIATWISQDGHLRVAVVGIDAGQTTCSAYSPSGSPFTGNRDGLTVRLTGSPSQAHDTVSAPDTPVSFKVTTADSTDAGFYTACLGMWSPDDFITKTELKPLIIRVELPPWLQITHPDGLTSSKVGDVHSNGGIGIFVPVNQYFFKAGTAGVVSARDTVGLGNAARIVDDQTLTNPWLAAQYPSTIQTRGFDQLVSLARSAQADPNEELGGIPSGNLNSICARGSGAYQINGDFVRNGELNFGDSPQCQAVNIIFFVDGDVVHNANIIDGTNGSTFTIIASGDVTVDPNVTRLDGVHIFGGTFNSGTKYDRDTDTIDDQLVIHGSVIGLGGQNPTGDTGATSFRRNLGFNNATTPAEVIAYQPKYLYLLRNLTGAEIYGWTEADM